MPKDTARQTHRLGHEAARPDARAPKSPSPSERCAGAAAQLEAVHRMVRHGPVLQLYPEDSAAGVHPGAAAPSRHANRTGLPDRLKSGVEALSGVAMDDVRVHYNSPKPAELQAHAYAQGREIHVAPGQERHLPHEAWHVVQQKQGRVRPTRQMKTVDINDDAGLEAEADYMGAKAEAGDHGGSERQPVHIAGATEPVVQGKFGFELEMRVLVSRRGQPVLAPAPVDADDAEESRFEDPAVYELHRGTHFNVVVDHGSGISQWVGGSGHSRRNHTAILELVTTPIDEFEASEDAAVEPMAEAGHFAAGVQALTNNFTTRERLTVAPLNLANIYVGQRVFPQEQPWQTTESQVQATYAVKLSRAADLAGLRQAAGGPLGTDQFAAMQNQGTALSEGASKANNLLAVLPILLQAQVAGGHLQAAQLVAAQLQDLKGLLTFAGTYLAGGRLDQGQGLDKNMVPLLLRHDLTEAFAQLSAPTQMLLQNVAVRDLLRQRMLQLHNRNSGDLLFPRRPAQNAQTNVAQPQCGAWLDAILTGTAAPIQGWFGSAKRIAPEPVGPMDGGPRPLGAVMEQRSVKTGADTVNGVPAAGWVALARRYYRMLRAMNQ